MKTYQEPFVGQILPITRNGDFCPVCASDSTFESYCSFCRAPKQTAHSVERLATERDAAAVAWFGLMVLLALVALGFAPGVWK